MVFEFYKFVFSVHQKLQLFIWDLPDIDIENLASEHGILFVMPAHHKGVGRALAIIRFGKPSQFCTISRSTGLSLE